MTTIRGSHDKPVEAVLQFEAGDFTVSISTIFGNPSLCVFGRNGENITETVLGYIEVYPSAENIAKAISFGLYHSM